ASKYLGAYYYNVLISVGINITLAAGLNLVNGYTGQFSLGHAGFMAAGAYLAAALSLGIKFPYLGYPDWTGGIFWQAIDVLWLIFAAILNFLELLHNAVVTM